MTTRAAKTCTACGRTFTWRRKWARDWDHVRYCSRACRGNRGARNGSMERVILTLLTPRDAGASICPSEAARQVDPERWRDQLEPVRRAARRLAAAGRVEITQRSVVVDPASFRGPIRIRLAQESRR